MCHSTRRRKRWFLLNFLSRMPTINPDTLLRYLQKTLNSLHDILGMSFNSEIDEICTKEINRITAIMDTLEILVEVTESDDSDSD